MKITERMKEKMLAAKKEGYTHVYSIAGAYRATTYVCVRLTKTRQAKGLSG